MNFKRFNGSTWETVRHKRYGSGTDSLTAFPAMIQASGEALTDYTIYGNTVQNGTPTPEAPVDVVGCGVRTGNLFDKSTVKNGYYIDDEDGRMKYNAGYVGSLSASDYIYIGGASNVYIGNQSGRKWGAFYDSTKAYVSGFNGYGNKIVPINAAYVRITVNDVNLDSMMLNTGSTALPYEPYGYKLPLTVNGTEYPIYLGQVETTRQIKKFVLTGGETFGYANSCFTYTFDDKPISVQPVKTVIISNAYKGIEPKYRDRLRNYECCITINYNQIAIRDDNYTDVADFKSYLAAQYANGTPVTVWYVPANPETGIVNEPLHKIGDYADTITMAQAEVTIPTSDGDNIISFGTTVKPSAMSATFKGWHPVRGAKQYDGSEWR